MLSSRISKSGRITLPRDVLQALRARPGDLVRFELDDGVVAIQRSDLIEHDFHEALAGTLAEWSSAEDDKAFADL